MPDTATMDSPGDYTSSVYDELDVVPTRVLWLQAKKSVNMYYLEDLERRATEQGIDLNTPIPTDSSKEALVKVDKEPTMDYLIGVAHSELFYNQDPDEDRSIYGDHYPNSRFLDHFLCSPARLRD